MVITSFLETSVGDQKTTAARQTLLLPPNPRQVAYTDMHTLPAAWSCFGRLAHAVLETRAPTPTTEATVMLEQIGNKGPAVGVEVAMVAPRSVGHLLHREAIGVQQTLCRGSGAASHHIPHLKKRTNWGGGHMNSQPSFCCADQLCCDNECLAGCRGVPWKECAGWNERTAWRRWL